METICIQTTVIDDWTYGKDPDHKPVPAIHHRLPDNFKPGDKLTLIVQQEQDPILE